MQRSKLIRVKITIDKIKLVRPYNSLSSNKINDVLNKKAKTLIKKSHPIYLKSI